MKRTAIILKTLRKLNIIWALENGTPAIRKDTSSLKCPYCREWSLVEMVQAGRCPYCKRII